MLNRNSTIENPKTPFLHLSLFFISGVGIAYQIAIMRIFSIAQWHHFAYMIISIAMLGFGASGTVLTLLRSRIRGREPDMFRATSLLLAAAIFLCYEWSQRIPFETFHLVAQARQYVYLAQLYVVLAIPFFLVSTCITLAFFLGPRRIGLVYFVNMAGSGLGAAAAVALLYLFPPERIPYLLAFGVGMAALLVCGPSGVRRWKWISVSALILFAGWVWIQGMAPIRISEYKVLSYTLQFPDAEIVGRAQSPLSQLTAVTSRHIRETPGQISNYPMHELGPLPEQAGLFFDAGAVSVINRFDGDPSDLVYLDYVTPALPYRVMDEPDTLIIGAGGGTDVLMALHHGASHVTAVEVDPRVFPMMDEYFREFSGRLYERDDVTPVVAEGRGFLEAREGGRYDVIQIALLDAFSAAASGVYALSESYLYTREAVDLYLDHLSPNGVLAITRWLKTPPRDAIKMFATLVEAAERAGIEAPEHHIAFIRSWNTGTILLSRSPFTEKQVEAIRAFSRDRWFDVVHYPGIVPDEVNRYTVLEEPTYYLAAQAILSPDREAFYEDYLFYVRPATDDRPYFFQFFKWGSFRELMREMGMEWVAFVEWGYIALVATIVQGGVVSALLILLPLGVLTRRAETKGKRRWVLLYFAMLGLAFMFLEIAFIQKFMLFLAYPVYSVAVVLTSFLIFSGLGSLTADYFQTRGRTVLTAAVIGIGVVTGFYLLTLPALFSAWAGWTDAARVGGSVLLLGPLAYFMGMPFPTGMQLVSDRYGAMVPWAWGINGFASVMGASLATFTSIHLGFRVLVLLAVLLYMVAGMSYLRLRRNS